MRGGHGGIRTTDLMQDTTAPIVAVLRCCGMWISVVCCVRVEESSLACG
jgi:hypothetical protein